MRHKPGSVMGMNVAIMELEKRNGNLTDAELDQLAQLRQQRAETMARRRTEYERNKTPLFAHEIPEADPQSYLDQDVKRKREWAERARENRREAVKIRRKLRMLLPDEYPEMRARWNSFGGPHTPVYAASFWRSRFRETIGIDPTGCAMPSREWQLDPLELDAAKNQGLFQK